MSLHHHHVERERGFTFVELALGLVIFVIAAVVLINHLTINYRTTMTERDRVFAYAKAQAILSEIQSAVDRSVDDIDLDAFDDGVINRPNLTVQEENGALVAPDHVLSGNTMRGGEWVWSRRITVQPFPGVNNRNVRYVTVRIYRREADGTERSVADLSSVINTSASAFPPSQVFDVYLLALENIPGWWVYMDSIRPFVESTLTDLETRNPGLVFRTHWITKASYGRNRVYAPYINATVDSEQTIPAVYFYPGLMPAGNASTYYYVPETIDARMVFDGTIRHGYDVDTNPHPYALADFYNHAMRLPEERAFHARRVAAIEKREQEMAADIKAGLPPRAPLADMSVEPTLRLLLEDMNTSPQEYRNAMVVNLHGELLPMPPMRNYSDAARDPEGSPGVRAVTHPEELRTLRDASGNNHDPVRLRVYAYTADPSAYSGPPTTPDPIALEVMGMDLTDGGTGLHSDVVLENLRGGVPVGGSSDYFPMSPAKHADSGPLSGEMHYRAEFVDPGPGEEKFTRILLYNTPVVAPYLQDSTGLYRGLMADARARLYGMEYVPGPVETALDFSRDLYTSGAGPKNTARWMLTIPPEAFGKTMFVDTANNRYTPKEDVVLEVRTRLWSSASADPAGTGTLYPPADRNQPDNLSATYTWWADSAADVPVTERSQFLGDPRHCPYKDLRNGDPDFSDGYNWFFDSLENDSQNAAADHPGLDPTRLTNLWETRSRFDVPRFLKLLREGLVGSRALYNSVSGFSFYYLGLGNDIGYDAANGYSNSIPVELTPYGDPGKTGYANNIVDHRAFVREGGTSGSDYWWGIPWLGELYPDSVYSSQWMNTNPAGEPYGNLVAGTGSGEFFRARDYDVYYNSDRRTFGTRVYRSTHRLREEGCTSFFNIGSAGSTFHHQYDPGTGGIVDAGKEIADNYNFPVPTTIDVSRPFGLSVSGDGGEGDEWYLAPYDVKYRATLPRRYFDHTSGSTGAGLVELVDPSGADSAYVVVSGISRTNKNGSAFIANFSLVSLVHSFFEGSSAPLANPIVQPPRVVILTPTDITELVDPSTVDVDWETSWERWDGMPYTATTPSTYSENESELEYVLYFSRDGGRTWLHIQDDKEGRPGRRPADPAYLIGDSGVGPETYSWSTPASTFPEGSYLLLVECFRIGQEQHYSYHRTKLYIQR